MFKIANADHNLEKTTGILDKIYNEEPEYWPAGLTAAHFDGGLYLVEKSASAEPVGFVGWQERLEGSKTVGYYSVGILPDYRRQGLAKQAVNKMLDEKAGSVDVVKAFIEQGNEASMALAESLPLDEIKVVGKSASFNKEAKSKLGYFRDVLGGLGTAVAFDHDSGEGWDKSRSVNFMLNGLLGGMGTRSIRSGSPVAGATMIGMAPAKDFFISGRALTEDLRADKLKLGGDVNTSVETPSNLPTALAIGGGALGVAGIGAYGLYKWLQNKKKDREEAAKPRVKVTLPTNNPGDVETSLDLPGSDINLSKKIYTQLARDTKRRLRAGGKERTRRRKTDAIDVESESVTEE